MDSLRAEIRDFLRWNPPGPVAMPVVESEVVDGGVLRKLITYGAADGEVIQAFLFEPVSVPRAAVVVLHQHASDWSLGKSEVAGLAGDPLQAFGPALARAGVMVLAPEAGTCAEQQYADHVRPRDWSHQQSDYDCLKEGGQSKGQCDNRER